MVDTVFNALFNFLFYGDIAKNTVVILPQICLAWKFTCCRSRALRRLYRQRICNLQHSINYGIFSPQFQIKMQGIFICSNCDGPLNSDQVVCNFCTIMCCLDNIQSCVFHICLEINLPHLLRSFQICFSIDHFVKIGCLRTIPSHSKHTPCIARR